MASQFVYVTYIRSTPEKIWEALTRPEFTKQYWFGARPESDWKAGSTWKMFGRDGNLTDSGEVLEIDPPRRLVLKWRNEFVPEMKAEGYTRCSFDLTDRNGVVELKITHEMERDNSKTIASVTGGWPMVLAGLKTLLETGTELHMAYRSEERRQEALRAGSS